LPAAIPVTAKRTAETVPAAISAIGTAKRLRRDEALDRLADLVERHVQRRREQSHHPTPEERRHARREDRAGAPGGLPNPYGVAQAGSGCARSRRSPARGSVDALAQRERRERHRVAREARVDPVR
jgi:hypothetical protein